MIQYARKIASLVSGDGVFDDGDWIESKDQDPKGGVRLIQLADVGVNEYLNKSSRFMTKNKADELNCTFLEPGDILVARMPDPIGRACIFPGDSKPCVTVVDICIVRPESQYVDNRWLKYQINSARFHNQVLNFVTGTTRQRISRGNLAELVLDVPALAEQKRIAAILDKADAIRCKRQQAIELADELLRAVFLDMFGDPVTNPKNWIMKSLSDLTTKIGSGATPRGGKNAYVDEGISLIRSLNIHDDRFVHKDLAHINETQADRLLNVEVEENDVLLNITGASVCRCAIVDAEILPARVNQHVCIIRPDHELLLPDYILHLIISGSFKRYLLAMAGTAGATREALTKLQIEQLEIPVPDIKLQQRFSDIQARINTMKIKCSISNELPLFDSLSQKAFAGEL